MAELAMSYSSLYQAKDDLYRLAEQVGPEIKKTLFAQIGNNPTVVPQGRFAGIPAGGEQVLDLVGDHDLARAIRVLYRQVKGTMDDAEPHLEQLGDLFGAVADAFFEADSQLAAAASTAAVKGHQSVWQAQQEQYDQYLQACGPDVPDPPENCDQTVQKPSEKPPTTWSLKTDDDAGELTTEVTLDDDGEVLVEKTVARYDGHEWSVVTTYEDDHRSYTTITTAVDGSTTKSVAKIEEDGSGTMTNTDADGYLTSYVRGDADEEWKLVGKSAEEQAKEEASELNNGQYF